MTGNDFQNPEPAAEETKAVKQVDDRPAPGFGDDLPLELKKVAFQIMSGQGGADPELLKQQDNHQFQIALKGLEATSADRREARDGDLKKFRIIAVISTFIVVALFALSGYALYADKTDFIIELIKAVGYVFGGFGTGVIFSKRKS